MRYLLDASALRDLAAFLRNSPLIAFDYDGTLAPLESNRDHASMRPETRELLASVARVYPVAVISGRSRQDLMPRIEGLGIDLIVGNHGAEQGDGASIHAGPIAAWAAALGPLIATIPGAELENKRLSLSLHYRNAADPFLAVQQIREAASELPVGAHVTEGKMVVNVVPVGAPNKYDALRSLMHQTGCSTALFAGDDTTDEDVFARADHESIFTVKVGCTGGSDAVFCLHDQIEIDILLARIAEARPQHEPNSEEGTMDARH